MVQPAKIDKLRLAQWRSEGKTAGWCAKQFGCSESAVRRAMYLIRLKERTVPEKSKSEISQYNIDVLKQQKMLNEMLLSELGRCKQLLDKQEKMADDFELLFGQWKDGKRLKTGLEEILKLAPTLIDTLSIQKSILNNAVEMRKQAEFQFKIAETLHNVQLVVQFKERVIEILREVAPEQRERFIKKMKEEDTIRGLIKMQ